MSERVGRARARALLLALSTALAPGAALAQSGPTAPAGGQPAPTQEAMQEARRRYERGAQLFAEGAHDAALVELTRAYELAPTANIFYNLGLVNLALNDYAAALRAFERYLGEAQSIPAGRRDEVERRVRELRTRVAHLEITASAADVEVLVDDVPVGRTPLSEAVMVSAGRHKVVASQAGKSFSRVVTVAGGDRLAIEVSLAEPVSPVAPRAAPAPPVAPVASRPRSEADRPAPESSSPLWIGWMATGALGAAAIGTGVGALLAANELDDESTRRGVRPEELEDAHGTMQTLAITTDVLAGAAVVAGAVTLYLTLTTSSRSSPSGVRASMRPGGAWMVGAF